MRGRLQGQRILVTGGGSGIGRAVVTEYVDQGAAVTVLERSAENADQLRRDLGGQLMIVVGDANDPDALAEAVSTTCGGTDQMDNLTCCVGAFDYYASVRELTPQELVVAAEEIWRVNVLSAFQGVNASFEHLRRAHGSVTLTLSESAFHPIGGGVLYGSSKWALRGAVAHLSADLAPEVRVNAVAPGGTSGTKFGGLQSLAQEQTADAVEGRDERIAAGTLLGLTARPEDHAGAYVYLADRESARVVTGIVINTDGGRRG